MMKVPERKAVVISSSSDIGAAMCRRWVDGGWQVFGTYRTESDVVSNLKSLGVEQVYCDLSDDNSVEKACGEIKTAVSSWDVLVLCPGSQDPVGSFQDCDFDKWATSISVNFISQMRIVHDLLPYRNPDSKNGACVLFFAGGGTNNATVNYSAYTISKIALIKMCELLDAEVPEVRFTIVGPGWVKTKIHEATLTAKDRAGDNYEKTVSKLSGEECTPMVDVLDCCDWLIDSPREVMGGRNFSVVFDEWGSDYLAQILRKETNMYKLRRFGNDILVKG